MDDKEIKIWQEMSKIKRAIHLLYLSLGPKSEINIKEVRELYDIIKDFMKDASK